MSTPLERLTGGRAGRRQIRTTSPLETLTGRPSGSNRLEREINALETDLGVDQQGTVLERASRAVLGNPLVKTVLDIVSRPNYAIAGAYEEMAASRGFLSASKRVGRELFSGVASIQGEKQGFGEVFEDLGYGAGGSISNLMPFAFSETGSGLKFRRGGFFDFTARGSLGLGLDIVLDPTTYLTLGAGAIGKGSVRAGRHILSKSGREALGGEFQRLMRLGDLTQGQADDLARKNIARAIDGGRKQFADAGGIKLFGTTVVPGEVFATPARSVADGVTKFLHKSSLGEGVISVGEGIGRVFNRDFRVRDIPEYVARKELYLSTVVDEQRNLREWIEDVFRGTNKEQRAQITNYIDSGGKTAIDPRMMPIVKQVDGVNQVWATLEQDLGLLQDIRLDYIFHAYDASPKRVKKVLARFDPSDLKAGLGGSEQARVFDTLEEARKVLASQGIKPIEDAAELMLRRGLRHIHGVETKRFFQDVADTWGVRAMDDALDANAAKVSTEASDIAKALDADELAQVQQAIKKGGTKIETVRGFSEEGQKLFMQRRFERVNNPLELERTMNKYREFEELWPDSTNSATKRLKTIEGENMAEIVDIPEFRGIRLPEDMALDIRDFNKDFINREEVAGLLRAYDVFMNTFKVGVTSIFPAFHFRNAYSNVVQQFTDIGLQALNPNTHRDAIRILAGDVNGSFMSRHGRRWGYGEAVYEAKRRGVIADYRNIFETFGDKIPIRTSTSKAKRFISHPVDTWKRFGGIIENEGRMNLFVNYLRRGLDPETAAQRVNKVLFDYRNLSKVERDVLARAFPFYRWCLSADSKALSRRGWKFHHELKVGEEILAFDPETQTTRWEAIKEIAAFPFKGSLLGINYWGKRFLSTADHRWPAYVSTTKHGKKVVRLESRMTYQLHAKCAIPRVAPHDFSSAESILNDRDAAILGWLVTDGYHRWKGNSLEALIYQSPKKHLTEIQQLLADEGSSRAPHPDTGVVPVGILKPCWSRLVSAGFRSKDDLPGIVTRLSESAARAMYDAMMKAEGSCVDGEEKFCQQEGPVLDAFQILCYLLGKGVNITGNGPVRNCYLPKGDTKNLWCQDITPVPYEGIVWCPVVESGYFVASQHGMPIITGNTRKNVALQADRLARNPGQAATQAKLTRQNRTDPRLLPSYLRGDFVFTLTADDQDNLTFIRGIDLPISDLNVIGQPLQRLVSDLAPLPKLLIELGQDRDFFRQQRISEKSTPLLKGLGPVLDLLPDRAKKAIDFNKRQTKEGVEYRMNPTLTYIIIKSWAISRIYGTAERVMRSKSLATTGNFLDLTTGVRLQDVDVDVEMERLEAQYKNHLDTMAISRGLRRRFELTFTPKD